MVTTMQEEESEPCVYTLVQYDVDPERIEYFTRSAILGMATSIKSLRGIWNEYDSDDDDDQYTEEGNFLYTYVILKTPLNKVAFINLTLTCCAWFDKGDIMLDSRAEIDATSGVVFRGNVEQVGCYLDPSSIE